MKYLRVLVLAIVAVSAFGSAEAQVRVGVNIGHPYHHRRVVVERHHRWHRGYHRDVVVEHRRP